MELAGRVGEDAEGDALLFALTRAGVGHAAVIRDPERRTPIAVPLALEADDVSPLADLVATRARPNGIPLDAADVTLSLRYLDPDGVLVVTDDVAPDAVAAAVEGGEFAGLRLVLLVNGAGASDASLPADATVLAVPESSDDASGDDAFDALVGAFAAALDAGATPQEAFAAASAGAAWEPVAEGA